MKRERRLNWRQGAPWWVLPLLVPGLILGALGFVLSLLLTDWWGAKFLVCLPLTIALLVTGQIGLGLFSLAATAFFLLGVVREYRAGRGSGVAD